MLNNKLNIKIVNIYIIYISNYKNCKSNIFIFLNLKYFYNKLFIFIKKYKIITLNL